MNDHEKAALEVDAHADSYEEAAQAAVDAQPGEDENDIHIDEDSLISVADARRIAAQFRLAAAALRRTVTEEMVERACIARIGGVNRWDALLEGDREIERADMRAALTAALAGEGGK